MEKLIIYQVLTRIWGDGKFSSWNKPSFDYLHTLGVDCIWYTGIPRHATGKDFVKGNPGSPYAVSDWYDVNPYLADNPPCRMEEFRGLVRRTHEAGLKCIVDFIPNHVACDYHGGLALHGWHDGDWTDTIKVDWSDERTEQEMERILRFWAGQGVDGFRCDMVELVPAEKLGRVISSVRKDYPELLFVAEVYQKGNYSTYLTVAGFDLLYDKSGSYDILRGVIAGRLSARELTWNWQTLGDRQGSMLNFLENHDEQRICSQWFAGTPDRTWAAAAFSMLFNNASFMYYAGQEVAEDASEGTEVRTSIFDWCHPEGLAQLWNHINTGEGLELRRLQVLSRYRELAALAASPVFRNGRVWDLCYCQKSDFNPDRHFAFMRFNDEEAWLAVCNFASTGLSIQIAFPPDLLKLTGLRTKKAAIKAAPCDFAVQKLK